MLLHALITFAIAMAPGMGLRFSIPWGLTFGHLPVETVFGISLFGETLSIVLLTYLLEPIVHLARTYIPWLDRIIHQVFLRTRHHHSARFEKFEKLLLLIAGASPVPGIGAHTGVVIAYLFGVKPATSIMLISLGMVALAIVVLLMTLGGLELWQSLAH